MLFEVWEEQQYLRPSYKHGVSGSTAAEIRIG